MPAPIGTPIGTNPLPNYIGSFILVWIPLIVLLIGILLSFKPSLRKTVGITMIAYGSAMLAFVIIISAGQIFLVYLILPTLYGLSITVGAISLFFAPKKVKS
jgi:hypothetical protein